MNITSLEYALMAANVYSSLGTVRSEINTQPIPDGWEQIGQSVSVGTGFMARAYRNGTDVVISYSGTTMEPGNLSADWIMGNVPGFVGIELAPQFVDAAKFYLDVMADAALTGASVSFTGHSLGGGIASIMSVWFNKPAVVFDEAPFWQSAFNYNLAQKLVGTLTNLGYQVPQALLDYTSSSVLFAREDNVKHIAVAGEALSVLPADFLKVFGTQEIIDPNSSKLSAVQLHSITLLTLFLESSSFLAASRSDPDLLDRIFNGLWATDPSLPENVLLDALAQREYRGEGVLDALSLDVQHLKGGGLSDLSLTSGGSFHKHLIDAALARVYVQIAGRGLDPVGHGQVAPAFEVQTGALSVVVNRSAVGDDVPNALSAMANAYLSSNSESTASFASYSKWTIQNGQSAMQLDLSTDSVANAVMGYVGDDTIRTGAGDDFIFGGDGSDVIDAGGGQNRLVGGRGDDWLGFTAREFGAVSEQALSAAGNDYTGGKGNDYIAGSHGDDTYRYNLGDGSDTIFTNGGADRLVLFGGPSVQFTRGGDIGIDLLVKINWSNGVGEYITVMDWFTAGTTANMLDSVFSNGRTYSRDAITKEALTVQGTSENDDLYGTAGYSDVIYGNGGSDSIYVDQDSDGATIDEVHGGGGADVIVNGAGKAFLYGDAGDDTIFGGTGTVTIDGGSGDDTLVSYGVGSKLFGGENTDTVLAYGDYATAGGGTGDDFVNLLGSYSTAHGNEGADTLANNGANNVFYGDAGNDTLLDYTGGATFVFNSGDGVDTAEYLQTSTLLQFSGGGFSASRSGTDLFVGNARGGVMVQGWFAGDNQASFQVAGGGTITSEELAKKFVPEIYAWDYAGGIYSAENLGSVVTSLDSMFSKSALDYSNAWGNDYFQAVWQSGLSAAADTGRTQNGETVYSWGGRYGGTWDPTASSYSPDSSYFTEFSYDFWRTETGYAFAITKASTGHGGNSHYVGNEIVYEVPTVIEFHTSSSPQKVILQEAVNSVDLNNFHASALAFKTAETMTGVAATEALFADLVHIDAANAPSIEIIGQSQTHLFADLMVA